LERHGVGSTTVSRNTSLRVSSKVNLESSSSSVITRDSILTKGNDSSSTSVGSTNPNRLTMNGRVKDPFGFFQTEDPSSSIPIVKRGIPEHYEDWLAKAETRDRELDRRGPDPDAIEVLPSQSPVNDHESMQSTNISVITGSKSLKTFKSTIRVHEPLPDNLSDIFPRREKIRAPERMRGR
jgi:hypothetical protein